MIEKLKLELPDAELKDILHECDNSLRNPPNEVRHKSGQLDSLDSFPNTLPLLQLKILLSTDNLPNYPTVQIMGGIAPMCKKSCRTLLKLEVSAT